jgi:hypothetical protein
MMELISIHPNAYKHGLTDEEIGHAWRNAFEWVRRDRTDGGIDYALVGIDQRGRLVELVARKCSEDGYIVFHALTPPTKRMLAELGLDAR